MQEHNQLPFSIEAEQSVIAAIFLDPQRYHEISDKLHAADFYDKRNQILYSTMGKLILRGKLDLVLLNDALEKNGTLEKIGGIKYIVDISNFVPYIDNIVQYAKIVKECAVRRNMINGYSKAARDLMDKKTNIQDVTDFVSEQVLGGADKPKNVLNFADSYYAFLEELDRRSKSKEKFPGIQTGFRMFDVMTGGLEDEKLYVLGGRPSMGKTALALNIAVNIARSGKTVMFFSLEMSHYEITKRIVSSLSEVTGYKLKTANVTDEELVKIAVAGEKIIPETLYIDDGSYQTIGSIASTCIKVNHQLKAMGRRIDCVIIDHLHLMSSSLKTNDRRLQIGEISRGSKILAGKLKCPIFLLSQLSRPQKQSKDMRPQLTDLRESGDIEQDADVVAFIHREEYYAPTGENRNKASLILAKVRDGECGTVDLGWEKSTTTFMAWNDYYKKYLKKDDEEDGEQNRARKKK